MAAVFLLARVTSAASCIETLNDKDFRGGDLYNQYAALSADCCSLCAVDGQCDSATWTNYNGGTCWMKKCNGNCAVVSNTGAVSFIAKPSGTTGPPTSPTPTPPSPTPPPTGGGSPTVAPTYSGEPIAPSGFCNPDQRFPADVSLASFRAATFNLLTTDVRPWDPRRCNSRQVIANGQYPDFLALEEGSTAMLKDLQGYGGRNAYYTLNGAYAGPNRVYLPGLNPVREYCILKDGPCNVWGTYNNCQGPGIEENQGFMLFYRNSPHLKLLAGGRKQFLTQEGCPRSEVVRNYEFGVFQYSNGARVVFYATHLAWPQATSANNAQSDELYKDARANFEGRADRPRYRANAFGDLFQLNVAGVPFVIAGDLNSFINDGKWSRSGINIDGNSQWDWVVSWGVTASSLQLVPTLDSTDHSHEVVVTYVTPPPALLAAGADQVVTLLPREDDDQLAKRNSLGLNIVLGGFAVCVLILVVLAVRCIMRRKQFQEERQALPTTDSSDNYGTHTQLELATR